MKRPEKKSESLEIRLPYTQKRAFMEACKERGVTASDIVRQFIADDLEAQALPTQEERSLMSMFKNNPFKTAAGGIGAALAAATFGTGVSLADDSTFRAYDRNGDGALSLSEFADRGQMTEDNVEVEEVRIVKRKGNMEAPPAPRAPRSADGMSRLFEALDTDKSGTLSPEEFEPQGSFSKRSVETIERDGEMSRVITLEIVTYDIEDQARRSLSIMAESRTVDPNATQSEIEMAFADLEAEMRSRPMPEPPMPPRAG
ncbi:hypothetical protein HK107_05940 [Parvularcula sp. ZS-1/3]|uniref:EF-hand domain-containing protein n=1 Tax=Parvularcula mediterranea TaxID=2732508 RepID=A0A7Y3W546_9PROT|nr:EF-hand domain-containing protein [Parvularcula mediterranea]NNU15861.1 hypothetical protein [Parvularcula mediterranea]